MSQGAGFHSESELIKAGKVHMRANLLDTFLGIRFLFSCSETKKDLSNNYLQVGSFSSSFHSIHYYFESTIFLSFLSALSFFNHQIKHKTVPLNVESCFFVSVFFFKSLFVHESADSVEQIECSLIFYHPFEERKAFY